MRPPAVGDDFLARGLRRVGARRRRRSNESGASVAHLRTGIVLSRARRGAAKATAALSSRHSADRSVSGRQWISPISLRDEVRAILWLLETRAAGPFNLVAPAPLTNRDFARRAGASTAPAVAACVCRAVPLRVALGAELADATVLASQRVVPTALRRRRASAFESPDIASILTSAFA